MNISRLIKYHLNPLLDHPLNRDNKIAAILRFIKWQLILRSIIGHELIVPFIGNSKFIVKKGRTGLTGNLYSGLHEFYDMAFLLHYLRPSDVFFDIGANVGSYSILSAACIGANTYSFEPVPNTFQNLEANRAINQHQNIWQLNRIAIGDKLDELLFSVDKDTENSIVGNDYIGETLKVKSISLDFFCVENSTIPEFIKIDAEGYDEQVILGFQTGLVNPEVNVIAIEGDTEFVFQNLTQFGFNTYSYDPFTRTLKSGARNGSNQLYIRDINKARHKVETAASFQVSGKTI